MSLALRPVLRPNQLPSLPSTSSKTTYTCQSCRHARLLQRPKRPYTFTQLVTLSDGSAFTMRTTSPMPVYRSTRDTRNAPLWNPSSKELMNVEDDEAGRLAGFRARFGKGFDAQREVEDAGEVKSEPESVAAKEEQDVGESDKQAKKEQSQVKEEFEYEFEDDDANLLDLISSYGQPPANKNQVQAPAGKNSKK